MNSNFIPIIVISILIFVYTYLIDEMKSVKYNFNYLSLNFWGKSEYGNLEDEQQPKLKYPEVMKFNS